MIRKNYYKAGNSLVGLIAIVMYTINFLKTHQLDMVLSLIICCIYGIPALLQGIALKQKSDICIGLAFTIMAILCLCRYIVM